MSKKELSANAMKRRWKTRTISFQTLITVIAIIFVLLAFIPIFLMLFLSLKSPSQFYSNLWAIPNPPQWSNYNAAYLQLFQNMVNSVITVTVGTLLIVVLSAMSGYVFASGLPAEELPVHDDARPDDGSRRSDADPVL